MSAVSFKSMFGIRIFFLQSFRDIVITGTIWWGDLFTPGGQTMFCLPPLFEPNLVLFIKPLFRCCMIGATSVKKCG